LAIDTSKIKNLLNLLDKYYHRLKEKQGISKEEFLKNADIQAIVERNFQLAIECCLNIGTHLIAALPLEHAEDYGTVFLRLARAEIIPDEFGKRFINMAKFRNLLVQVYWEIDSEKVYYNLRDNLEDLKEFASHILKFIETQNKTR